MAKRVALGPDPQELYTYIELPIGATAVGILPGKRKTGLWRYMMPRIEERVPPCQEACPVGNWIQRFVAAAASGDMAEASRAIWLENPFPGVCGRVCYHPCEASCNRKEVDGATSIHAIERHVADHFFGRQLEPPMLRERQAKKTAVVGSGPAGLACAYFLRMMGYGVTVFEEHNVLGGVPRIGIPAYRLPKEVLDKEIQDILALGVEVKTGCRVGKDLEVSELLDGYDAVFLATGAHKTPALNIPGETAKGVYRGLDFLSRFNLGDGLELGHKVLVIGGGNVAIDVCRTLLRLGRSTALLYRRTREAMPAHAEEIDEAIDEGTEINYLLSPISIAESGSGNLILKCARMEIQGVDPEGRPRAVPLEGETVSYEADQIVLATGEAPDLSYLPEELKLTNGFVRVNQWGQTNVDRVFAGGDTIDQPWTVSDAIGSAKRAAIAMDHFLRDDDLQRLIEEGALARTMRQHLGLETSVLSGEEKGVVTCQDLNLAYCQPQEGRESAKLSLADRVANFDEVDRGLDPDAAVQEAERCLSCGVCKMCGNCYLFCPDSAVKLDSQTGRYTIDYDYCKGCGVCRNECPVSAIIMEAEGES